MKAIVVQLEPSSPPSNDSALAGPIDPDMAGLITLEVSDAASLEADGTLRLLQGCVEALGLMQAKCESLETEMNLRLDAGAREIEALRDALAMARTDAAQRDARLYDSEARLARIEEAAQDATMRFADELAMARNEASTWRLRSETDAMAFEHLNTRMRAIEEGLSLRLERTTRELATSEAANAQLAAHATAETSRAAQLEAHLREVEATVAEQRVRMSCLQSKLAVATSAMRMDNLSRSLGDDHAPAGRDILDLAALPATSGLISAA